MRFALMCHDKPGFLEVRKANRDAHLAYIKSTGIVEMAGPLLNEDGEMCGSLIVLEAESRQQAEAWAEGDPYKAAGLFKTTTLTAWNKVIG